MWLGVSLIWAVSLNKFATKLQRPGKWREPNHVAEYILIDGIQWYVQKLRMLSTICSQIVNALILFFVGGVWSSNQHWECLQSHAPHPGWYHIFYLIENDWEQTKRKILFKTCVYTAQDGHFLHFWNYLIVGCLPSQDGSFCIFKTISSYAAYLTRMDVLHF